jgi:hypothetical protein
MEKICLDAASRAQLSGFSTPVEVCDESGQTLGHFLPAPLYGQILVAWSRAEISDEELERRRNEPGGSSLQEIWERLGNHDLHGGLEAGGGARACASMDNGAGSPSSHSSQQPH